MKKICQLIKINKIEKLEGTEENKNINNLMIDFGFLIMILFFQQNNNNNNDTYQYFQL